MILTGCLAVIQGLLRDSGGNLSDGRRMAAGFLAGITEALIIVTPFEVIKIRLQQQKGVHKDQFKYKVRLSVCLSVYILKQ